MTATGLRVVHLIVSAAPPVQAVGELIDLLQGHRWDVYVIATPTAMTWIDATGLEDLTGHPVHSVQRRPDEISTLPPSHAVVAAPATFNLINKCAAGINDSLALGILNEAIGAHLPVLVSPYAKAALAAHPTFGRNLETLRACGVALTPTEALRPPNQGDPFNWQVITNLLDERVPGHGP